ncbi:MAG TPA: HIT family protein [Chloroflexota bacterium]|jgi:histidine triad (HIT) family protein|nr:HIT family protein [Chloroflexota bacterium]
MSDCQFCGVATGREQAYVVFEDDDSIAFLDIRPVFHGHVLLIPRQHYETMMDLPLELGCHLFTNAQLLARAVESAMAAEGVFVAINNRVSQSVPHVHIHLVPRRFKDGLRGFFWPRTKYPDQATAERARDAISAAVQQLRSCR